MALSGLHGTKLALQAEQEAEFIKSFKVQAAEGSLPLATNPVGQSGRRPAI